jgi:nucleotide-binding universal stress UspA family protein
MPRIRRILHPSDFSPASARAFRYAVEAAKVNRARLVILHVLPPVVPVVGDEYVASPRVYVDLQRAAREEGERQVKRLVSRAKQAGLRAVGILREGTPADGIVRAARGTRAGMIVMGTHGRTGVARLLLGSVATRVIGTAPCPVLTVRAR